MKKFLFIEHKLTRLAKRMQKGDAGAAESLYGELADKVFGFCLSRVRHRHFAEDLTQEIFLKLVTKIEMFDAKKGDFTVWFWQLARNTLIDHYRRQKDSAFSDLGDERKIEALAVMHPEPALEKSFEKQLLDEFLKSLDQEEQELFRLRYVAELSYKEMSDVLERSEGALRVAVNRLKKKIHANRKSLV